MIRNISWFLTAAQEDVVQYALDNNPCHLTFPSSTSIPHVVLPSLPGGSTQMVVAHTDTVWGDAPISIRRAGSFILSNTDTVGIGADDRAGVYAALELRRRTGCAVLLTADEETNPEPLTDIATYLLDVRDVTMLIEMDRGNANDCCVYSMPIGVMDGDTFTTHPLVHVFLLTGFNIHTGTHTDICRICPQTNIGGVNISCGYVREHTPLEQLDTSILERNISRIARILYLTDKMHYTYTGEKYVKLY